MSSVQSSAFGSQIEGLEPCPKRNQIYKINIHYVASVQARCCSRRASMDIYVVLVASSLNKGT